ncbi:hypothetical protein EG329_000426 [Mollisiaceae sp. DMI_Dod_QoI]|nr:hypothetical protein EG329_000426 [Helotiales sp. DMI_Dod_QoI]
MRSLSTFSVLALLAALSICFPHLHIPERNLGSSDLEALVDLFIRDVDGTSAEPGKTGGGGGGHPQTGGGNHPQTGGGSHPQSQPPRQTQRPETQHPQSQPPRQTQRPETQHPQTQRPETQRPQTQRPETQHPETQRPETHTEPRQTFTQPRETHTQPQQTQPRETHTEPRQTFTQPRETHTEPQQTQPRETHTEPRQTFTQPRETHTEPQQTYTQPRETHTEPRQTFTQPRETHTQPQQTYTQPRETHTEPHQTYTQPQNTYTNPRDTRTNPRQPHSTYTSVYNPNPPWSEPHRTHHRTENDYTTIYVNGGMPTTYYQPIYIQPTYYQPPPTITLAPVPVTYTTVYVYPDTDSDTQTYYSTITTYVLPSQQTSTTYVYQTYVPPPATTAQAGPGAEPTPGVNPWAASCPVPSDFIVNNFVSNSGGVSLSISYNGGTFTCPNNPNNEVVYNGMNDMYCDDDGLVRVITDGANWLWISEWSWCNAVPANAGNMPTLEAATNYTNFGYYALDCTTDSNGIQTCNQAVKDFSIPVVSYGLGGAIGFEPLDINGNFLPGCPSATSVQPIVTNTASCAGAPAQSTGLVTVTIIS